MMMASILLSFGTKNTSSAAVAFFFLVSSPLRRTSHHDFANADQYMLIFGGTINCVPWVYVSIRETVAIRHS